MFYSSSTVDELLKCVFCRRKFTDTVKLIPECGNSICGECYNDLQDPSAREFECYACQGQLHKMPQSGLPDNVVIIKMLQLQPEEKALPEKAKELKTLISEADEELEKLQDFSELKELNAHCDQLVAQVNRSIDEKISLIIQTGASLLKEVEDYRNELISKLSAISPDKPAKRAKLSDEVQVIGRIEDADSSAEQDLGQVAAGVKQFKLVWTEYFTKVSKYVTDSDLDQAQAEIKSHWARLRELLARSKAGLFDGRMMQWLDNDDFYTQPDLLGKLAFQPIMQPAAPNPETLQHLRTLQGHSNSVFHAVFLHNGQLASSSMDKTVKIWRPESGELVAELVAGSEAAALCLANITPNLLAAGYGDGAIKVWRLDNGTVVKTINAHGKGVFMLRVLSDSTWASISWDNTIKIWPIDLAKDSTITITGHHITQTAMDLGVLPSGQLVTCSSSSPMLKVWDSTTGQLVRSVSIKTKGATSLAILTFLRAAVGFSTGKIALVSLNGQEEMKTLANCHKGKILFMAQLPDGHLATCGSDSDPSIKIWNLGSGQMVRVVKSAHSDDIWALSLSKDAQTLASSSGDKTIKLWSLV